MIKRIKFTGLGQSVFAIVLAVCVLAYTVYHITGLFGEEITTIVTGIGTETQLIDAKGYVFRDETVLYSENTGVADYYRKDGEKVSVGEALCGVRDKGSSSEKKLLKYYDEKIAILKESVSAEVSEADIPTVSENILGAYYSIANILASGQTSELSLTADTLLCEMNKYSLITDENSIVDDTLESMTARREALLGGGSKIAEEKAPDGGYFYSYVDGYESYFTAEAAQSLSPAAFEGLTMDTKPDAAAVSYAYGKLAKNSEWYFAVRMAGEASGYFKIDEQYNLQFSENANVIIPMTLTQSVTDTAYSGRILVFFANRLPEGFVFDRCQSVSIETSSTSGIYVPRSAVHREKEGMLVYVLKGSVVKARRIEIIYEASDYYLCAEAPNEGGSIEYLGTNELLVVSGRNLFDGRILD